ncbi:flavin reductase [Acinetobacter equi]|uniref:Flavin reductase n=1 Tax=Acinetobacter equi TaxID=1324350 RepID=A0A0N9V9U8_9GAMM|nr:flavin reductase [Acinetobacter equi]ALH96108.1 flavin reductase [Acinetobacter equi]
MIQANAYRDAMSYLTSAVNIVTTSSASGYHGFTASAVCSVTDTPPTLLVCMNKSSRSHVHFLESKILAVNVLAIQHEKISNVFASKLDSIERFKYGKWTKLETGAPILNDALVSFDCYIDKIQEIGTHTVFICPIIAINKNQQHQGLVYFNRNYHSVGQHEEMLL